MAAIKPRLPGISEFQYARFIIGWNECKNGEQVSNELDILLQKHQEMLKHEDALVNQGLKL